MVVGFVSISRVFEPFELVQVAGEVAVQKCRTKKHGLRMDM